jgi:hypothetical protein
MPSGTRYRVKTTIKDGVKKKIRLAFHPKTNEVIETKKLHKKKGLWK